MRGGTIEGEIDYETFSRIDYKIGGGIMQLVCYGASDVYLNKNIKENIFNVKLNEIKYIKKDNIYKKTYKSFINFILKPINSNNYKPIIEY
jgi:hypothetical protein